ncbi:MAG: hypothetical protein ACRDNF_16160 [Streptosporangiaceae bacterium]
MSQPLSVRLLLDEMFSPIIAAALRDLGHDVTAVAEQPGLRHDRRGGIRLRRGTPAVPMATVQYLNLF